MQDDSIPSPGPDEAALWDWAHEEQPARTATVRPSEVAAILVVVNAEDWLARTLVALARLEQRPGVLLAVDQGSTDGSRALLERACDEGLIDEVLDGAAGAPFGEAVARAVPLLSADRPWLWLLHDDVEPRRDALGQLLLQASAEPAPDLIFPALLEPRRRNHADRVAELGQTISGSGNRVLSVDPGDVDQQHIDSGRVLGGSTAGLMITRAAYDHLGGLAPELPSFRDGVDLGWRANEAGMGVVTAPTAGLYHLQAGRFGIRHSDGGSDAASLDSLLGMRLVAARSPHPGRKKLALVATSWARGVGLLLGKAPREAAAEFRAGRALLADGPQIDALARRSGAAQPELIAGLRPARWSGVSRAVDRVAGGFSDRYRDLRDDRQDLTIDELTGDEFAGGWTRTRWMAPTTFILTAMLIVALVAARFFTSAGSITGPRLLPSPDSVGQAWRAWLQAPDSWAGMNAPWLGLTALASSVLSPEGLARGLLLGAPLLAALSFHGLVRWAWGAMSRTVPAGLLAVLYGLGVVLYGATGRGSLAASLLAIIAPRLLLAVLRWFTRDTPRSIMPGAERWRAPASVALWLTLAGAMVPLFWLLGLVIAVVHPLITRTRSVRPLLVALAPILVAAPWLPRLASHPARLLTSADPLASPSVPPPGGVLAFAGGGAGWGAWTSFGLIALAWLGVVCSVVVAIRRRDLIPVATAGVAAVALALAIGLPKLSLVLDGVATRPDADPWFMVSWVAAVASIVITLGDGGDPRPVRPAHLAFSAVLWVLAIAACAVWVSGSRVGQLQVTNSQLPAYVQAVQDSDRQTRTLMIEVTPAGVRWSLVSQHSPEWGTAEQNPAGDEDAARSLRTIVRQVEAGSVSESLAQDLATRGIAHLWLRGGTGDQVSAIGNAPGLTGGYADEQSRVWTVQSAPSYQQTPTSNDLGWAIGQLVLVLVLVIAAAPSVSRAGPGGPRRAQEGEE